MPETERRRTPARAAPSPTERPPRADGHFGGPPAPVWVAAAVAVLAATAYANALANGLVWDDPIVLHRQLLAFRSLHDIIFTPRDIPQYSPDYYRPLTTVSYLLDRAIGGSGPFMFHLSVVLYHVAASCLVFYLGLQLFGGEPVALAAAGLGAALFAVHPIHTESVAWGAGRSDVLACCCSLAATVVYLRRPRRAPLAALLVFAGMLAKETAVGVLLLLPLAGWLLGRDAPAPPVRVARTRQQPPSVAARTGSTFGLRLLPFAAVFFAYFGLRQATLGTIFGRTRDLGPDVLPKLVGAVGLYACKLLLPIRQSAYISTLPTQPAALAATGLLLLGVLAGAVLSWRRQARAVTFLLAWMGVTLAPSLSIVVKLPAAPVAERYLYLPSVGFCLLAGYGAARLLARAPRRSWRIAVGTTFAGVLVAAGVATVRRNAVWRSNLTLWQDTALKNTTDGLPLRSLATAYYAHGDFVRASQDFHRALRRHNDRVGLFTIHNNLGSLAMREHHLDEAEREYQTALSLDPNAPDCLYNVGLIALTRALETAANHDPDWKHAQLTRARRLFERAAWLSPLDPETQVGLGQTLSALGDPVGARAHFRHALDLGLPPATAAAVRRLLDRAKR